jgi:alanyl-tRNA synthetase
MTERLYYRNSFLREFDAQVRSCDPSGDRWHVLLDRTAFYPASGGQPYDTGHLGDAAVLEVFEREDEEIVHVTGRSLAPDPVRGVIDWDRRFDHMQQHTAQHLLSAAFIELFQFPTVSFHLGWEVSTIDLAARSIVPRHLEEAERRVNRIIFEDRPISVSFATMQQLAESGVRKKVEREGPLRVIEIEGFDRQPCGGTHLERTGQAGLLLILRCERQKGNWRVEFVAGFRALAAARGDLILLKNLAEQLSCGMPDVPAIVAKLTDERRAGQKAIKQLHARLAQVEANDLLAGSPQPSDTCRARVITAILEETEAGYLGQVAARMVAEPRIQVLLAGRVSGTLVFAQSPGLEADMGSLLRELVAAAGGNGGGNKFFAQGSIANPSQVDEVISRAAARLRR